MYGPKIMTFVGSWNDIQKFSLVCKTNITFYTPSIITSIISPLDALIKCWKYMHKIINECYYMEINYQILFHDRLKIMNSDSDITKCIMTL